MIQLTVLNGSRAGHTCVACRFPFQVGRSAASDLVLEDAGVWEAHAGIDFRPNEGFFLQTKPGALVSRNGQRVEEARLVNGDLLECGSVKLRFWLAPFAQRSLRPREVLTWLALAALLAAELGLIYRLLD